MCIVSFCDVVYLNDFQWSQGAEKIADALKQNRSIATIDMVRSDPSSPVSLSFTLRPDRNICYAHEFVK